VSWHSIIIQQVIVLSTHKLELFHALRKSLRCKDLCHAGCHPIVVSQSPATTYVIEGLKTDVAKIHRPIGIAPSHYHRHIYYFVDSYPLGMYCTTTSRSCQPRFFLFVPGFFSTMGTRLWHGPTTICVGLLCSGQRPCGRLA